MNIINESYYASSSEEFTSGKDPQNVLKLSLSRLSRVDSRWSYVHY